MIYLLTLGWPWFAGALALGALVGFLTFSRGKNAAFSGGWIVALGALVLAAGAALSFAEILDGRDAAAFDIALLAGLAYAAGLPLGGGVKSLAGAAPEKMRPAPPLVATPARAAPETVVASEPMAPAPALADAPEPAAVIDAAAPEAHPAPARAPSKKSAPGVRPESLAAPRDGAPDNLSRIKGVGPKSLEKLNALGVFHYDQIAGWDLDNAKWIGAAIGAPGRVERDKWIQQARALSGAGAESK